MKIYFDIQHFYYLPQYLPVKDALAVHGIHCQFIVYQQTDLNDIFAQFLVDENLSHSWVANSDEARELYQKEKPDWIIFGNAFKDLNLINQHSKTALMQHGIGPKSCYYHVSNSEISYRFVEGQHRLKRLQEMFPNKRFIDTGYAKLDPIINGTLAEMTLADLGLDANKPTLLYAPTFYPSSIERLPDDFPNQLNNFNLIIKPHYFSFIKKHYKAQRKLFKHWLKYDNVFIADLDQISILPFMNLATLMISDASSALFEFTALNKPAIWCDFYKLRWSYRGIFKKRLNKRLDEDLQYFGKVAQRVANVKELIEQVNIQINQPELKEKQRLEMTELLTGKVDGLCSERISNFILEESREKSLS